MKLREPVTESALNGKFMTTRWSLTSSVETLSLDWKNWLDPLWRNTLESPHLPQPLSTVPVVICPGNVEGGGDRGHFSMIHCVLHSGLSYSLKVHMWALLYHCFLMVHAEDPRVNTDSTAIGHLASLWFRESLFWSFVLSQLTGNPRTHKLQPHIGMWQTFKKGSPSSKGRHWC